MKFTFISSLLLMLVSKTFGQDISDLIIEYEYGYDCHKTIDNVEHRGACTGSETLIFDKKNKKYHLKSYTEKKGFYNFMEDENLLKDSLKTMKHNISFSSGTLNYLLQKSIAEDSNAVVFSFLYDPIIIINKSVKIKDKRIKETLINIQNNMLEKSLDHFIVSSNVRRVSVMFKYKNIDYRLTKTYTNPYWMLTKNQTPHHIIHTDLDIYLYKHLPKKFAGSSLLVDHLDFISILNTIEYNY